MGRASRLNPRTRKENRQMKEFRVTVTVRVNEVQIDLVPVGPGQAAKQEQVKMVQVTEAAGVGGSPAEALKEAMENGISAYIEGMAEANEKVKLFAPGGGVREQ